MIQNKSYDNARTTTHFFIHQKISDFLGEILLFNYRLLTTERIQRNLDCILIHVFTLKFTHASILNFHIIFRRFTENIGFSRFLRKIQRLLLKHTYQLTNIIYVDCFQNNLYYQVIVKLEDFQVCIVSYYVTPLIVLLILWTYVTYNNVLDANNAVIICNVVDEFVMIHVYSLWW